MEDYFCKIRDNIIGIDQTIPSPYRPAIPMIYADWTASGRLYRPIEDKLRNEIFPLVANTHTDTNYSGMSMTYAYHKAQQVIKAHVGASPNDVIISSNSGMTGVVNKFQRILGLKLHEAFKASIRFDPQEQPVIFITHMEHHSNQTSWLETIAEVVVVPPDQNGLVSPEIFKEYIDKYPGRKTKIAAVTSCSNVTGIMTPYMDIAQHIHSAGGLCFVDFACSAPYVHINMHESDQEGRYLDAIYFSPHKFLGGPGSSGILIFNKSLYKNMIPDSPGGGTVYWTNPWGGHTFVDDIEAREDGGTPAFLQTIKAALCCRLKEEMGVENITQREHEMLDIIWPHLDRIPNLHVLAPDIRTRLGIISFYIDGLHYNLGVKMLNDRFGIQTRGGCSCAGTYGHFLFNLSQESSNQISELIKKGDCSAKPGWIRLSLHPTQTNAEIEYICEAIRELAENFRTWSEDYVCDFRTGSIRHKNSGIVEKMEEKIDHCLLHNFV